LTEALRIATPAFLMPALSPRSEAGGLRHGHVPEEHARLMLGRLLFAVQGEGLRVGAGAAGDGNVFAAAEALECGLALVVEERHNLGVPGGWLGAIMNPEIRRPNFRRWLRRSE
jgi:hypothetical protein